MNKFMLFFVCGFTVLGLNAQITLNDGYYYHNGQLFSGMYEQKDDQNQTIAKIQLKNGLPDGISEYFNKNQLVETRSYKKGLKQGIWEKFEDGKKISEAEYLKDRKHGKWSIWDTQGTLRYEMYYKKGKKTGVWKMFDEKGALISEKVY